MMNQIVRRWGIALMSLLLLGISQPLSAQSGYGTGSSRSDSHFVLGGNLSLWHNDRAKTSSFLLAPNIQYQINSNLTFGGELSLYHYSREGGSSSNSFLIRPFLRYHYFQTDPIRLYFEGGLGLSSGGGETGFEIGVRPGMSLDLSRLISLNFQMGFLGYRSKYAYAEEGSSMSDGIGLSFTPASLRIGIEFHL